MTHISAIVVTAFIVVLFIDVFKLPKTEKREQIRDDSEDFYHY